MTSNVEQTVHTYSVFGNVEYRFTDQLAAHAGLRYSSTKRDASNCVFEQPGPNPLGTTNEIGQGFSTLSFVLRDAVGLPPMPVAINQGDCYNLSVDEFLPGRFFSELDEDNLSWRAGITYTFDNGVLIYANNSRGFKEGVVSGPSASSNVQFAPAKQERLDATEIGLKAPLFDRRAQINLAGFWYDYKDKQVRTRINDPFFQQLETIRNVPESRVLGFEASIETYPLEGLLLSLDASYLDTEVTNIFLTVGQKVDFTPEENLAATGDPNDPTRDYQGSELPFTPEVTLIGNVEYAWPVLGGREAFLGGVAAYRSSSNATFSTPEFQAAGFELPAYTTLDLRAGLRSADGRWSVMAFGQNVTNEYSINAVFDNNDQRFVYTGRPATYGVRVSVRH